MKKEILLMSIILIVGYVLEKIGSINISYYYYITALVISIALLFNIVFESDNYENA